MKLLEIKGAVGEPLWRNPYSYADNNPTNLVDPSGMIAVPNPSDCNRIPQLPIGTNHGPEFLPPGGVNFLGPFYQSRNLYALDIPRDTWRSEYQTLEYMDDARFNTLFHTFYPNIRDLGKHGRAFEHRIGDQNSCWAVAISVAANLVRGHGQVSPADVFYQKAITMTGGDPTKIMGLNELGATASFFGIQLEVHNARQGDFLITSDDWKGAITRYIKQNTPLLALVNLEDANGNIVKYADVRHWVVISAISDKGDWVQVSNPFNNRVEYYKWDDFYNSIAGDGSNLAVVK